jgi:ribosomal protein L9
MAKTGKAGKSRVTDKMISTVMQEMGRKGGQKKVPKGFAMLTKEERSKRAKAAAKKRWAKNRAEEAKKGAKV